MFEEFMSLLTPEMVRKFENRIENGYDIVNKQAEDYKQWNRYQFLRKLAGASKPGNDEPSEKLSIELHQPLLPGDGDNHAGNDEPCPEKITAADDGRKIIRPRKFYSKPSKPADDKEPRFHLLETQAMWKRTEEKAQRLISNHGLTMEKVAGDGHCMIGEYIQTVPIV